MQDSELAPTTYEGPAPYALADWRLRINDLYAVVRTTPDPEQAWRIWCAQRDALFGAHPMSPLPEVRCAGFNGIAMFDYDPGLRFKVDLIGELGAELSFDLGLDGQFTLRPIARTDGLSARLGGELVAYWIEGYSGGLFIPFKDASNGHETYGGGRYLVDAIKGSDLGLSDDGRLILDFNFAYNPSCAFSDAFVCPLSPPANELAVTVRAGERAPEWTFNDAQ